jgi:hypothetical protein
MNAVGYAFFVVWAIVMLRASGRQPLITTVRQMLVSVLSYSAVGFVIEALHAAHV